VIPAPVDQEIDIRTSLTLIGIGLIFFLSAIFIQGGIIAYIRDLVKTGSASLAPFIGNCVKYFLRMLAIVLLTLLIGLGWGLLLFAILPVLLPAAKTALLILGIIVLIGLMIMLILPGYALVASELGAIAALRKGVSLAAANFLRVVVILVMLVIIAIVVMFIGSFITWFLSVALKQALNYSAAIVMAISSGIVTLLADIVYMDFYLKKA
jgi:hypothetical protein